MVRCFAVLCRFYPIVVIRESGLTIIMLELLECAH